MSLSTLLQIKKKTRRMSASPSPNQLSEADLEEYINTFYELDFPSALKVWNLHDKLEFFTQPNEDRYAFDTDRYYSVTPPVYVDGYNCSYSQSREELFRSYPKLITDQIGPTGNGSNGPYTFTLSAVPVLKRDVTLSMIDTAGANQSASDVPDAVNNSIGTWIDNATSLPLVGSINYVTGACSITWGSSIGATENIAIKTSPYSASRPSMVLFFKNYFLMRPVPDKVYKVSVEVYSKPTQLLTSNTVSPDVNQWWQYIAIGAAIKVLQDRQDMESIQNLMPFFKEQEALIMYRTATQQAPERTATIFTSNNTSNDGYYGGNY